MIAGIDFPSQFTSDNIAQRRSNTSSAGVAFDPDSLLSGAEIAQGMSYTNSARNWINEEQYNNAVAGKLSSEDILAGAPRVLKTSVDYLTGENEELAPDGSMEDAADDFLNPSNLT